MAIHLRENQYKGVNAHLQSIFHRRSWRGFHNAHITHLSEALQQLLPPESGYIVMAEESLQVDHYDPDTEETTSSRPIPDVSIYGSRLSKFQPQSSAASEPVAVVPLRSTFNYHEPDEVVSVMIYKPQADELLGLLVTRLELISPANKPPGSGYREYLAKRAHTLQSGVRLVEVDYFHERRSAIKILPSYLQHEPGAAPYTILVNDPAPEIEQGKTIIYRFKVDEPIPKVQIPLLENESVVLDFGAVYNHTFNMNAAYGLRFVNYSELPELLGTYDEEDQQRIQTVMKRIQEPTNGA